MLLVPDLETVVILVPRTGSGSLRRAILQRYPQTLQIYRHMEADGVPQGYDRWRKIGFCREPTERLWSLYKFMGNMGIWHPEGYRRAMRESVSVPFSDWILRNQAVFTAPYDSLGDGRFYPGYCVRHPLPENIKSQWMYLRPDLGTEVYPFNELDRVAEELGVHLERFNCTERVEPPQLTDEARRHIRHFFKWDLSNC